MRFLILTQYYPPEIGAAQARLSAFAGQLQRAGHEVEVVTALPNYPGGKLDEADRRLLGRREVLDGVPVRRTWLLTATGVGARRLASYLSFAATGLVSALVAGRPDVVFVESPPLFLGVSGWMAARRAGAAFVLNVSDLWPDSVRDLGVLSDGPALRAAERLERWLYARATAVTAVTQGIREVLLERKGVPPHKALFLPNGVDLDQFRPTEPDPAVRARHGLPDGPLVLFTGNHGYAQALETVIAAERLERWLYARATAVTAVTEGIRQVLLERKGVPSRKALFLPNGVDLDQFRPTDPDPAVRARHGLPAGPLVLFTGNHGYAQALETVIAAAAVVPEVTVVLVGAGSDKARIQGLAEERGTTNVRFLPPVPQTEIAPLYGQAVAGLATLRNSALMEGARPAKALAVMGCGRPVIYSGAGEGAALVRAADAGLVVPPEDPRALAAAIRRLAKDPAEAARMGANGRRYVEAHLSWPALTDAWLADLERVLGQDPSTVDAPHHAS